MLILLVVVANEKKGGVLAGLVEAGMEEGDLFATKRQNCTVSYRKCVCFISTKPTCSILIAVPYTYDLVNENTTCLLPTELGNSYIHKVTCREQPFEGN